LIVEGYFILVTKFVKGDIKMCWNATSIITDAYYILNSLNDARIQHVYKEGNQVAGSLMRYKHKAIHAQVW